jgi:hypothetical protein
LDDIARRLGLAADELVHARVEARCVQLIAVPSDEVCFFLFEAESEPAVHEVGSRADVAFVRVAEALTDAPSGSGHGLRKQSWWSSGLSRAAPRS